MHVSRAKQDLDAENDLTATVYFEPGLDVEPDLDARGWELGLEWRCAYMSQMLDSDLDIRGMRAKFKTLNPVRLPVSRCD